MEGVLVPVLDFSSLSRNGSTSLVMQGTQGWKAWATPAARNTYYFCRALWDSSEGSERWELGHGQQSKAASGCSSVSSQLLIPFASWQLVDGCSTGHWFMLLLLMYALSYLWLIFSWMLLALGLLTWCHHSHGLKASHLCSVLALLQDTG